MVHYNKYPWEVLLFIRIGKEGTESSTEYGFIFESSCPTFQSDWDTWNVWDQRKDEDEHKTKTKQCSGSLITNSHILTSAECVTSNREYLRQVNYCSLTYFIQSFVLQARHQYCILIIDVLPLEQSTLNLVQYMRGGLTLAMCLHSLGTIEYPYIMLMLNSRGLKVYTNLMTSLRKDIDTI